MGPGTRLGVICALALAFPASAGAATSPLLTDGAVTAITASSSTLYLGGIFSRVSASPVGEAATISTSTGVGSIGVAQVTGGLVSAVVADGSGGWYLGGVFTAVGGAPRSGLAHILANGSVDASFHPTISGSVAALAVSNGTLYVGGKFALGTHTDLVALNKTTGAPQTGVTVSANGPVDALLRSGTTLYVGGSFTQLDSATHDGLGAVSTMNGAILPGFNPTVDVTTSGQNTVSALAISGGTLYLGGIFGSVDSAVRISLAAVNASNGTLVSAFNPGLTGGEVAALAIGASGPLYVGGGWDDSSGSHSIAALDASTGNLDGSFSVALTSNDVLTPPSVASLLLSGGTLYVGGRFSRANLNQAYNLAAVSASTGAPNASWHPNPGGEIGALALAGTKLEAGGDVRFLGGTTRHSLAAIHTSDGSLVSSFAPNLGGYIFSLALSGTTLYVGGSVSGGVAALNASNGSPVAGFSSPLSGYVYAIVPSSGRLYVGGQFSGSGHTNLAALSATNGSLESGFTATVGAPSVLFVSSLALSSGTLYVGGLFTRLDGVTRNRIGAVSTSNGSLVTGFDPNANGAVNAMALSGGKLYLGGGFTTVGTTPVTALAAVNPSTGAVSNTFSPVLDSGVKTLIVSGSTLYAGGPFTHVDGKPRSELVALNTSNGSLASSTPPGANGVFVSSIMGTWPYALRQVGTTIYVGGAFLSLGSHPAGGFGSFTG